MPHSSADSIHGNNARAPGRNGDRIKWRREVFPDSDTGQGSARHYVGGEKVDGGARFHIHFTPPSSQVYGKRDPQNYAVSDRATGAHANAYTLSEAKAWAVACVQ